MTGVKVRHEAERTCLGCRRQLSQSSLLRITADAQGRLISDFRKRLPGRGGYVCYNLACLKKALSPGRMRRALRTEIQEISFAGWIGDLTRQLEANLKDLLSVAGKARKVLRGRAEILQSMKGDLIHCVLIAVDCAPQRRGEVENKCRGRGIPFVSALSAEETGRIVGGGPLDLSGITDRGLAAKLTSVGERLHRIAPTMSEGDMPQVPPCPGRDGCSEGR